MKGKWAFKRKISLRLAIIFLSKILVVSSTIVSRFDVNAVTLIGFSEGNGWSMDRSYSETESPKTLSNGCYEFSSVTINASIGTSALKISMTVHI